MSWNKHNILQEPTKDDWGGTWTEKKLQAFSKYVWSYLQIMKSFPWQTIYFDGFAGSGTKEKEQATEIYKQLQITEEEERTYKGAAERVLSLSQELSFNFYYFIDKKKASLEKLKLKLDQVEGTDTKKIIYKEGNANQYLLELASALNSNRYAALVFLDPFGMQIDWSSIEALKGTRSDVWILIPTGVIVNRLLEKSGDLKHIEKLQSFFGMKEEEIKGAFYNMSKVQTLFGETEIINKVSNPIEKIARLYAARMKTVWSHVTEEPLTLKNRSGTPIFHFVFASNKANALKIAKQIIQKV